MDASLSPWRVRLQGIAFAALVFTVFALGLRWELYTSSTAGSDPAQALTHARGVQIAELDIKSGRFALYRANASKEASVFRTLVRDQYGLDLELRYSCYHDAQSGFVAGYNSTMHTALEGRLGAKWEELIDAEFAVLGMRGITQEERERLLRAVRAAYPAKPATPQ